RHGVAADRLPCGKADELERVVGRHDMHLVPEFDELSSDEHGLVCGDASGNSKHYIHTPIVHDVRCEAVVDDNEGDMCTVILEVPDDPAGHTRLLAVRDEMPDRPWDPPGFWWPELPGVRGVRDRQAGGAWLAAKGASFSVILNRPESVADLQPEGAPALGSRG